MSGYTLPLVLRKDDHCVIAVYDEHAGSLTELTTEGSRYTGDYRNCEIRFNPAAPNCFAHCSTDELRYSRVDEIEDKNSTTATTTTYKTTLCFAVAMPYVVTELAFSPRGRYLVTYATMYSKVVQGGGNLCIFDVATGAQLRRFVQVRWPALAWTCDESLLVRVVSGSLQVLPGELTKAEHPTSAIESVQEEEQADKEEEEQVVAAADEDKKNEEENEDGEEEEEVKAVQGNAHGMLSALNLAVAQDKEIDFRTAPSDAHPLLGLYKAYCKQRPSSFALYRLPDLRAGPLLQVSLGRSESGTIVWSPSGLHVALLVKSERDPSGKSYYGTVKLQLIDVMKRSVTEVKLPGGTTGGAGGEGGGSVHDCVWSPKGEVLLVVHGKMPRNCTTLLNVHGTPLMTVSEAPRNMGLWAPNGLGFVLGGSGNLAGDYQFYCCEAASMTSQKALHSGKGSKARGATTTTTAPAQCTGEFNEKCSLQQWAPDSHHLLCATVFTRLRMDNKLVIVKNNGRRVVTQKYAVLYGADWVQTRSGADYPLRPVSPRPTNEEQPAKAQAYRPPGGVSRAAMLLRRPTSGTAVASVGSGGGTAQMKPAGPVGATVLVEKRRKKR